MTQLDPAVVEAALRKFIADVDYDIHKAYESDEETGEDTYDELAETFIHYFQQAEDELAED